MPMHLNVAHLAMDARPTPELLLQHGRFLRALAASLVRDPELAEDVVQETWLRWLSSPKGAVRRLRGWLAAAARHQAANAARARERRARHEALGARPEEPRSPAEEAEQAELLHRVVDAVFALEEPYRETILARYFRGEDTRSIARSSGVPASTVRSREQRALAKLRERLDRGRGGRGAWAAGLARLAGKAGSPAVPVALALAAVAAGAVALLWTRSADPEEPADRAAAVLAGTTPGTTELEGLPPAAEVASSSRRPLADVESLGDSTSLDTAGDPGVLHGIATDLEGVPLAGVRIFFERDGRDQPVAEATSDEEGRFRAGGFSMFDRVEAELPGYVLLHANDPGAKSLEPWGELHLTLARAGRLAVTALDGAGRPVEGLDVSVQVVAEDRCGPDGVPEDSLARENRFGVTDVAGRAAFEDIWAGVKLDLGLDLDLELGASSQEYLTARQSAGRLCLEPGVAGAPIFVPPGGTLELVARWEGELRLRGVVLGPDGRPAERSTVHVADLGRDDAAETSLICPDGRFDLTLREPYLRGPVLVQAWKDDPGRKREVHGLSFSPRGFHAWRELDPRVWDPDAELRLDLEPLERGSIVGRLLGRSGAPVDGGVMTLQPRDPGELRFVRPSHVSVPEGRFFCILGLEPGACDLAASFGPGVTGSTTRFGLFRDVPVDAREVALRLPATRPVRVRLRFTGTVPAQASTLTQVWFPRGAAPAAAPPPRALRPRWPSDVPCSATWSGTVETDEGCTLTALDRAAGGAAELLLEPGDPGWYRFGLLARNERGASYLPLCTDLAWFAAGEHVLDVELAPTTTLSGRVIADGAREFLHVSLVDEHGSSVPLVAAEDAAPVHALLLPTHGRFHLPHVPLGHFLLRAGSLSELMHGHFRRELPLEIGPGTNPFVEIRF